jgi:DNA-binding transcriptional LysR family regulator
MPRGALSDLDTFLLVAEHLSFRAAAERLGLTPPAVSHSMASSRRGLACGCSTARQETCR